MIEINNLNLNYNTPNGILKILSDFNLSIKSGEIISIIGPSGCGKTSLLRLICNLIEPSNGMITINGETATEARVKHKIGFVFQDPVLFDWRTVVDNIKLPEEISGEKVDETDYQNIIRLVGLNGYEMFFPKQLSGGMRSRVSIARSLVYNPDLLLMDEPFSSLDEITRDKMNLELLKIWQKIKNTIIFVTHNISEAILLSDQILVMSKIPAKVKRIVNIKLPRPRELSLKESLEFVTYAGLLRNILEDD